MGAAATTEADGGYPSLVVRAVVAGLIGCGLLAGAEYGLIDHGTGFARPSFGVRVPLLIVCAWYPYVTAVAGLLLLTQRGYARLAHSTARARAIAGLIVAVPAIGWGVSLAVYTFSGPQAQLLWYRPIAVVLLPLLIAATVLVPFGAFSIGVGRAEKLQVAVLAAGSVLALVASRVVLPGLYERLHAALALVALLHAACAAAIVSRSIPAGRSWGRAAVALALPLLAAFAGVYLLASKRAVAFVAYNMTPGMRYVLTRHDWHTPRDVAPGLVSFRPDIALDASYARAARKARATEAAPHIIVVSLDNIQADRVGAYGYAVHPTTPNIDALAARGLAFDRAYSWFPRTRMFNASLLLGRLVPPFKHFSPPRAFRDTSVTRLLQQRGYYTFVHAWLDNYLRFTPEGFGVDTWMPPSADDERRRRRGLPYESMEKKLAGVKSHFARATALDRPVFAWMHLLRAHHVADGHLPDPNHDFGSAASDHYDSAIAAADAYVGAVQRLADSELQTRPIYLFVISDHGTGFVSAGKNATLTAARDLGEEFVHVPFIVAGPGIAPGRSDMLVSSAIDTAATVLDLAGMAPPADYDGVSLMPIFGGYANAEAAAARAVYLQYYAWTGLIQASTKVTTARNSPSVTDVLADPRGTNNLVDADAERSRMLEAAVAQEQKRIAEHHARAAKDE